MNLWPIDCMLMGFLMIGSPFIFFVVLSRISGGLKDVVSTSMGSTLVLIFWAKLGLPLSKWPCLTWFNCVWLLPPRLVGFLNTYLDAAFGKHGFATAWRNQGDTKQQSHPAQNLFPLLSQAIQALSGNSFLTGVSRIWDHCFLLSKVVCTITRVPLPVTMIPWGQVWSARRGALW